MQTASLDPRFNEEELRSAVSRIANEISSDYAGETPLMVGILKGCFVFLADLVREMTIEVEIDFVRARSYGKGTSSSGAVEITKDIETDLSGRHVVVVEDIEDTGLTMEVVVERIRAGHPASVRRCALLVRKGTPRPDYMGFEVGPGFVVGYGIDYAERYRGLRGIEAVPGT
ncbi:MAG: hypoxanthine phosphoribosyltransferase [Acidimicrobiia bacterium]|jgi:hypoxanthine phosphoribosyltransferase